MKKELDAWVVEELKDCDCGRRCEGCPYHQPVVIDAERECVYTQCEREEHFWGCGVWEEMMGADL